MNNELISIIVPVYNTEFFLETSILSILNQTYENLEIILVDDGSSDNSLKILENFALKDNRIKILKQENQGQGVARNLGLLHSKGNYIIFVDSDDRISKDMVFKLYKNIVENRADFSCCRIAFEYDSKKVFVYRKSFEYRVLEENIYEDANLQKNIYSSPVNKIYSKEFLVKNNLKFPIIKKNEDILFTKKISYFANRVSFLDEVLYYAYSRSDSTSRKFSVKNLEDTIELLNQEKIFLIENNSFKKFELEYKNSFLKIMFNVVIQGIIYSDFKLIKQIKNKFEKAILNYIGDKRNYSLLSKKYRLVIKMYKINFWFIYIIIKTINVMGYRIS